MTVAVNAVEAARTYEFPDSNDSRVVRQKVINSIQRIQMELYGKQVSISAVSKQLKRVKYDKIEELHNQGLLGWYIVITVHSLGAELYYKDFPTFQFTNNMFILNSKI